ncbi:MAG: TatD family hydrolase, partial [Bacteroidales bacterium]|nr:TatD family hydrolase [Bacteroidales bacterium]
SSETFREIQRLGEWYVGRGGVATFKKASIGETLKEIPLDRILLETDSPYLTPVPHRGERNESAYIPFIAEKIATQQGISVETVAEVTTANAEKLFKI